MSLPQKTAIQDSELLVRIKTVMVLRLIFLTGFVILLITFERNATRSTPVLPLSIVLCTAYFLSLSYALFLRVGMRLGHLAWMQVVGDLFVVGGLLFATGGIESPLSFLYLFVVIETSVILPRSACYLAAAGASILYGTLVDLEYFQMITPVYFFPKINVSHQGAFLFYTVVMNVASYFAVAFLSSILTHRLRLVKEELEKKQMQMEHLEEFHQRVIQQMGNGLMTTDAQGRITSANTAFEGLFGYRAVELKNRYCYEVLALDPMREFFRMQNELVLPHYIEDESRNRNGEPLLVGIKISMLSQVESGPQGYICVFEDLTEIRRMEEKVLQNEQLAAVGRFSAGLAHEIRNPLASLSGSIQYLREGLKLDGTNQRLMEIVLSETERLNEIVTGFLSYSLPKKKKPIAVDFTKLLEDVVSLLKNSNEFHSSLELALELPPERVMIESDPEQLKQMVWNLCINGIQAMDKEGVLKLSLCEVEGHHHPMFSTRRRGLLFTVEDQGKGISEDKIELIFDPFFTTREEGVGLGLATVRKIIEQLGGHIGLTSEEGVGTVFEVFLPQERALIRGSDSPEREMPETAAS
ncbi:MAG: PAS domain S-box protein [Nitrospina sp.]|nr:PAS domain S-box protein [Nitrospina sp.]